MQNFVCCKYQHIIFLSHIQGVEFKICLILIVEVIEQIIIFLMSAIGMWPDIELYNRLQAAY